MNTRKKDLLIVFNIFGEWRDKNAQLRKYCQSIDSILWHINKNPILRDKVRFVVSAVHVPDMCVDTLKDTYKGMINIVTFSLPVTHKAVPAAARSENEVMNKLFLRDGRLPVQVTFNKASLFCEEHFREEYNGYFYISAGLLLPHLDDLFPRIIEKNNSGEYGIIQLQTNRDHGYDWLGKGDKWEEIDFSKDYQIPIGNQCNWHIAVINKSIRNYFGVPSSDVHGSCGHESAMSYKCYSLRKKYILLGNSECRHPLDGRDSTIRDQADRIGAMEKIPNKLMWGREHKDFLHDTEGIESGLGYYPGKQCNNPIGERAGRQFNSGHILSHKQSAYDENCMSIDPRLKEAVKRNYFANSSELVYSEIGCTMVGAPMALCAQGLCIETRCGSWHMLCVKHGYVPMVPPMLL